MNCAAILLCLLPGGCVPGERASLQQEHGQPAEGMLLWYPVVHRVQKKRELEKKKA